MKFLITAGPTREHLDPVRFISNPSSGKMGYAMAGVAMARGHEVRLISGPVVLSCPRTVSRTMVTSAREMLNAVEANVPWCEALVMSAAVADWRPRQVSSRKLKKADGMENLSLVRTPDILLSMSDLKEERLFVGFAAETENMIPEARRKLEEKHLDLMVANDVTQPESGFGADSNQVTLVGAKGFEECLPLMSKDDVAERIVSWIEKRWLMLESDD